MNSPGIYKIVNLQTNDFYIGSAKNLRKRFVRHKWDFKNNRHPNLIMQRIWNKYGENIFKFEILEILEDCIRENVLAKEQIYINALKPHYNLTLIAGSHLGTKRSEETKAKMSKSQKGKKRVGEARENGRIANFKRRGSKLSEKHIANAVKGRMGYVHSEEVKLKMKASQKKRSDWPHEKGNLCNCEECKERRNSARRLYKGPVNFIMVNLNG